MTKIKFCGLRDPRDAAFAESLGAAYAGVILTKSIRNVSASTAREIFTAAPRLKRVGVFSRESIAEVLAAAREADLDVIQLHTVLTPDDHAQLREEFDGEIWNVVAVDSESGLIGGDWKKAADMADALLLDTSVRGATGGTGMPFDWSVTAPVAHEISAELPVILAGGLNPKNVGEAIGIMRPAIVDVSSGVESSPGTKSRDLMSAFAKAVLSASIV